MSSVTEGRTLCVFTATDGVHSLWMIWNFPLQGFETCAFMCTYVCTKETEWDFIKSRHRMYYKPETQMSPGIS